MKKLLSSVLISIIGFVFFPVLVNEQLLVFAQEDTTPVYQQKTILEISFFYKIGCFHCEAEEKFLDKIEKEYPEVKINRYSITEPETYEILGKIAKEKGAEKYIGLVPLTFVGDKFFLGFDNENGVGKDIENVIREQLGYPPLLPGNGDFTLPLLGKIDLNKYSLPSLAVILGFLDGFNVCSLGALTLILGLVLTLRSRTKILFLGGAFILTTALIYGILIFIWYQIFSLLVPYMRTMEILIGILAMTAAFYSFKQFLKFKKQGPVCEMSGKSISSELIQKVKEAIRKPGKVITLTGAVLLFAAIITIVEFPCSAALPVVFAGILSKANLSILSYLSYLSLYLLFYLLDEIIVFLVALFTMKIWISSSKLTLWFSLVAAIIMFLLGIYYLF